MPWVKVGGPAHSLAMYAGRLAALSPDRQSVFLRHPTTGDWKKIGGPADELIGGAWDLYARSPGSKEVWRYDGNDWTKVGGMGNQFVGICNALYMLNPSCTKLSRFDRNTYQWTEIGGPANAIITGGSKLYASAPDKSEIWEYNRFLKTWTKIGTAGSMWVGVNGTIYGLTPNKQAVYRYNGTPNNWTKVGGPADSLIGGGSSLYAVQPGTQKIWKYSGNGENWSEIGTPGVGFVAWGNTLVGMTTDKKEVYQYTDDNDESKRLNKLIYNVYDPSEFSQRVMRGYLVKRVGGDVLAEHNSKVCFQPLSTLKLLPYLHTLVEVDLGNATMQGTTISWTQPTSGTADEIADSTCLTPGASGTQAGSANLKDALPTMMWQSHNRTLDSVLSKYGPSNLSTSAHKRGFTQTEMYFGCPQPGGPQQPWADNISTLRDIASMFEKVEGMVIITKANTRELFRNNMITLSPSPGTSYTSPITGKTVGPLTNEYYRSLVEKEAGPSKLGMVNDFMKHLLFRGKGGGGGPNSIEIGYSDFLYMRVPFKSGGQIVLHDYVIGWYVCQFRDVSATLKAQEDIALETFKLELAAAPIREAWTTW